MRFSFPPEAPSNASLPLIAGSPIVGNTLASSTGSWGGAVPISYAYQWQSAIRSVQVFPAQ